MDMLLMNKSGSRGGICYPVHRHAKTNNRYMRNQGENKEFSYIAYLDKNSLYGYAMRQRLPSREFELVKIEDIVQDFIKNCDENSDIGYFLKVHLK